MEQVKELSQSQIRRRKYYADNREKAIAYSAAWNKDNPEKRKVIYDKNNKKTYWKDPLKVKNRRLKYDYGISLDDFVRMRESQNNLCAICEKRRHDDLGRGLSVDHDHKTGKVRGLLCPRCNGVLGYFEKYRMQMLQYLERASC